MQRIASLLVLAFGIATAHAATFPVTNLNDSGAGSLREAIANANATSAADTITFSVAGTIVLTSGALPITAPLTITGPGAANLTIDGNANSRIFTISEATPADCPATTGPSDYLVSISGLTLRNAHRNTDNSGGAIFSSHSLALNAMVIRDNAAKAGAGVSFLTQYPNQSLTITNSEFHDNVAKPMPLPSSTATGAIGGGAVRISENCPAPSRTQPVTVSIAGSLFKGNRAQPTSQIARGGAILSFSHADISITDSRLVDNAIDIPSPFVASYLGGAVWASARSVTFLRTEIADNFADVGGAIGFFNDASDLQTPALATDVSIVNSTISNNTSTGSPIIFGFGNVAFSIANSTIVGNTASHNGTGGVAFNTGPTVPPSGQNALGGTLQIDSSILWNPGANNRDIAKNATNLAGPMTVSATNSIIGKVCDAACGVPITLAGPGNQVGIDPQVGLLQFNGGATRTRALLLGSPAIGAGTDPSPPVVLHKQEVALNGGLFSGGANQLVADAFVLPAGGLIDRVVWYGNGWFNQVFGPMSISIHANAGDSPGAVLMSSPVTPTIVATGQINSFFNGQTTREVLEFTAAIPAFQAAAGTQYFVSIRDFSGAAGNFVWVNSGALPSARASLNGGENWGLAPAAVAYTLLSSPLANDQRGAGFPRTIGARTDAGAYEYAYPADCAGFTDVTGADGFCANVAWLKNRRVTLGCSSTTLYCPIAPVSRLAMAAFMKRLGDSLTPVFVDAQGVLSSFDLATTPGFCDTADFVPADYPRRVVLDTVITGIAAADAFARLNIQVSTDAGMTWSNFTTYGGRTTFEQGQWRNVRNVGVFDLPAGQAVRFRLGANAGDPPSGATVVGEGTCHLRARIENSTGISLP